MNPSPLSDYEASTVVHTKHVPSSVPSRRGSSWSLPYNDNDHRLDRSSWMTRYFQVNLVVDVVTKRPNLGWFWLAFVSPSSSRRHHRPCRHHHSHATTSHVGTLQNSVDLAASERGIVVVLRAWLILLLGQSNLVLWDTILYNILQAELRLHKINK